MDNESDFLSSLLSVVLTGWFSTLHSISQSKRTTSEKTAPLEIFFYKIQSLFLYLGSHFFPTTRPGLSEQPEDLAVLEGNYSHFWT